MKKIKTNTIKAFLGIACIALVPVIFFVSRGLTPVYSELSFMESSVALNHEAGTVVPASCESSPQISHSSGDCTTICSSSANSLYVTNTVYDFASNSCICSNGSTDVPTCQSNIKKVDLVLTSSPSDSPYLSVNFTGNTTFVMYGGSLTLTWTVTGVGTTCSKTGSWGAGSLSPTYSGTYNTSYGGRPNVTKSYSVSCTNSSGTIIKYWNAVFEGSDGSLL